MIHVIGSSSRIYTPIASRVKWSWLLSEPVNLRQRTRQGGVLSTSHVKIGSINIPQLAVADDLAVLSRKYGPQQIKIWAVKRESEREMYCINPS